MARPAKKTRKTRRKQKGAGTQQVKVLVYLDPYYEHAIHINNLSEKRINSIVIAAQDFLNEHFKENSSPNHYFATFDQINNSIVMYYGTHGETFDSLEKKNFPPGALQKILSTRLTVVVVENDVFYVKFVV
jgi:hypothetical protein